MTCSGSHSKLIGERDIYSSHLLLSFSAVSYVPGTRLEVMPIFYKIFTKPKETDTERLGNLPNITQLLNSKARVQGSLTPKHAFLQLYYFDWSWVGLNKHYAQVILMCTEDG